MCVCVSSVLQVSSRRYHDVEALSDLQPLQQHCDTHGVRFPMLAARIACTTLGLAAAEEARIIAERYGTCRCYGTHTDTHAHTCTWAHSLPAFCMCLYAAVCTRACICVCTSTGVQAEPAPATTTTTTATTVTTTSGSVPVVQQQGDPESALRLLTFARITPPYPEPWLLEAKLLQAALRPAARTLASRLVDTETQLRNTAQAQGTVQASSAQAGGTQTDTSTQPQGTDGTAGPTTATPAAATATPATAATVTPATAEDDWDADIERDTLSEDLIAGLDADWYAGVQARIAVNVFRVDTVLPPSMTTTITTAHEGACVGVGVGQGQGQDGGVPGERQDAAAELARLAAEMVRAESGAAGDGARGTGSAMFLLSSFLNHSCVPNLEVQWPLNNAVVVSVNVCACACVCVRMCVCVCVSASPSVCLARAHVCNTYAFVDIWCVCVYVCVCVCACVCVCVHPGVPCVPWHLPRRAALHLIH